MSDRHLPGRGKGDPAPPDGADLLHEWDDFNLPSYLGSTTFQKLPLLTDVAALAARRPDVVILGAPLDDGVSHRPGARFGPRAIRAASYHTGDIHSLQTGVDPFDWLDVVDGGDMPIVPGRLERGHAGDPGAGARGGTHRRDPDRARRRPLDHVPVRECGG